MKNLKHAKENFKRLLKEFPESEWAYDAKEKFKKINEEVTVKVIAI